MPQVTVGSLRHWFLFEVHLIGLIDWTENFRKDLQKAKVKILVLEEKEYRFLSFIVPLFSFFVVCNIY